MIQGIKTAALQCGLVSRRSICRRLLRRYHKKKWKQEEENCCAFDLWERWANERMRLLALLAAYLIKEKA